MGGGDGDSRPRHFYSHTCVVLMTHITLRFSILYMAERKGGNLEPIDQNKRDEAQRLYMNGYTYNEINELTGVKPNTLAVWASRGNWAELKDKYALQAATDSMRRRSIQIDQIMKTSFDGIIKLAEDLKKDGMSVDDALKMAKVMAELNKIARLDAGKPTDLRSEHRISEKRESAPPSKQEIIEILKDDPFHESD